MLILFSIVLSACCLIALTSQRYALAAVLLMGFIQDPFRKLVAGEPIFFIVTVGVVFGLLMLKTIQSIGFARSIAPFVNWVDYLYKPLTFFVVVLLIQFFHSLFRWGNVVIGLIGLLSYVAPFLAIIVGYYSVNNLSDVRKFMKVYVSFGLLVAGTVALSFSGFELSVFREVGAGLKIYDQGTILRSFSGIMRTGEIAAWHIATTACLLIVLYTTSTRKHSLLLIASLMVLLLLAIAFTGRRKMLMLVSVFGLCYLFGFFYFRKTLSAVSVFSAGLFVFMAWLAVEYFFPGGYSSDVQNYLARGASVYSDASDRFVELGLKPIQWAYSRVGLFGGGLGIGSQGAHLFQVSSIAGGSSEGGLGKVMVELGLPGLFAIVWLMYAISKYILSCIKLASQPFVSSALMAAVLGFAAFLLVNLLTFTVASQIYGDMFILIILGLVSGFVFALPNLVVNEIKQHSLAQHERSDF